MSGSITIREMENVARGGPDFSLSGEIGNVINLNDMTDDLGLDMLANTNKISVSSAPSSGPTITIPAGFERADRPSNSNQQNSVFPGLQEVNIEPLEPISVDASIPIGVTNIEIRKDTGGDVGANLFQNQQTATGPTFALPSTRDPEGEKREKIEFINKLQRLESKGFPVTKHYTLDNSLEEIKQEYTRLVDARNLEGSLRFQRQMLMGVVTGLEYMNNRFDPFDVKLDGWSESVHENVEDFDEIFEELYDKYKDKGKMAPEMRLLVALAGSGFMCHVSNTFFRQKMPTMDEVLRKNPELARQMATAAAQQAGPGFGNFMGMAMGAGGMPGPSAAQMPGPSPMSMPMPMPMPSPMPPSPQIPSTGAFFQSSRVPNMPQSVASVEPPRATARREMKGPSGVDDILKTFEEVRRAEAMEAAMPPMPSGPTNQPAVAAVAEIQSIHSEDMRSQAESVRTSGGRRRRRAAVPEGNTLSLNV
jgi:hypothetical protein